MNIINILGCGWYGLPLGKALVEAGYNVSGSTTSANRINELKAAAIRPYLVDFTGDSAVYDSEFFNCDTLIISIPPKLRGGEHEQYILKTQQIIKAIKKHAVKQVIFVSSTGVYPEINGEIDEDSTIFPDTESGKILLAAENLFKQEDSLSTTVIRFGGLVGPGRHPGRFFAGKTNIPNGQAPVNLIHLQDCIGITMEILKHNAFGYIFNACSPHHPAKQEFYTLSAIHAGLPAPQFVNELSNWKIINSVNAPKLLNYQYTVNNWAECFADNRF